MAGPLSESVCKKNQNSTMHWKNTEERTDERAVSPVIGVIMMVAVTVILAAIISMLVLGMGQDVDANAQASFTFEKTGGDVVITHEGGDTIDEANLDVYKNGNSLNPSWSNSTVSAGTTTNVTAGSGDTLKVVWTGPDGETATLATYKVP